MATAYQFKDLPRRGRARRGVLLLPAAVLGSLGLMLAAGIGCRKVETPPPPNEARVTIPELKTNAADSAAGVAAATNLTAAAASAADRDELMRLHQAGGDLIQQRRFEEAITVFQNLVRLKPEDEEAHFNLGFCFARLTQLDQAVHHYSEAIRFLPEYAEAHNNLGNLLVRQGRLEKAMEHFKAAVLNGPESSSAHNNLGTLLVRLGKIEEAIPNFAEATRLNTNYVEAFYNLGRACQTQGRIEEAIPHYQRAIQIDPSFEIGRSALKTLLDQRKSGP